MLRLVAGDEVYEHVALQGPEMHNSTLQFILGNLKSPAERAKALDLDRRWRNGQLKVPCVWSRRMALVRLPSGGTIVYAPVELSEALRSAVQGLGPLRGIVLPNSEHAVHWEAWKRAFPGAALLLPPSVLDHVRFPAWAGAPVVLRPGAEPAGNASELLEGLDVEVVMQSSFNEVVLQHRASGTLLTTDFMYFGGTKSDKAGWPHLGSCTDLYFEAWCAPSPPDILLPEYRLRLSKDDRSRIASSLERILAWRPACILSSHAGKNSEGGPAVASALLRSAWGWCGSATSVVFA